jgi:hypothetical protein
MSLAVLALVLAAAFAHAGWNFLAKGAGGGATFVWVSQSGGHADLPAGGRDRPREHL